MQRERQPYQKQSASKSIAPTISHSTTAVKSSLPNSLKVSYQQQQDQQIMFNNSNDLSYHQNSSLIHSSMYTNTPLKKNYHLTKSHEINVQKKKLMKRTEGGLVDFHKSYAQGFKEPVGFPTELEPFDYETQEILKAFAQLQLESVPEIYDKDRRRLVMMSSDRRGVSDTKLAPIRPEVATPNTKEFRQFFKGSDRYSQYQHLLKLDPNIYCKMNEKIQSERLMPRSMKLFQASSDRLVANDLLGSDPYVELFTQGLSSNHFQNLKFLQMKNNHLNSKRITMLTNNLPRSLLELDLSSNPIGSDGIKQICQFINSKNCFLQTLILEDNQIRDTSAVGILKTLQESKTIKVINLSKNNISDYCMESMASLLRKSCSLQEVYLHYNQIRSSGGVILFKALFKNQYLKVLDLSFNKLGSGCVMAISEVLAKPHPELTHVDFSYNNFNNEDAFEFHKSLVFNPYIFGFHFEGMGINYSINSRGFLVNMQEQEQEIAQQKMLLHRRSTHLIQNESVSPRYDWKNKLSKMDENMQFSDPKLFKRIQSVNCINYKTKDNCWICEGWTEIYFKWTINKSGTQAEFPIFLHLDFDDYRPMIMHQDGGVFELYRMCPPNRKTRYFFSNPLMDLQFIAKDQKTIALEELDELRLHGVPLFYADGTIMQSLRISIVNYIQTGQNKNVIDASKHYVPTIMSHPRVQEKIFDIDPSQAKNRAWSIENSIFKDFQADSEGHLLDCFDFDFECGRLQKHIPNLDEIEELKSKIKLVYKNILSCYRYYCSQTQNYEIPCINQTNFVDFISQTSILEKSLLNNIDLQLTFLSSYVITRTAEFHNVVDKCLVRFQFLEIIIRLAKEQYLRTGICRNIGDALEKLFYQDQVLKLVTEFGISQDWRDSRYWTQLMDSTIKMKLPVLQQFYEFCVKLTFKHQKYITLTDFKMFFLEQLDFSKYITEKEVYLIYLQSMQTQRDEVTESKHIQMQFLEFIEGIARVAERISPVSPMYAFRNPPVNRVTRKALPLFVKFEGILYVIFQKLRPQLAQNKSLSDVQLLSMEKEIIMRSFLKTVQAKKLGVFDEEHSSDEEREIEFRSKVIDYLPSEQELLETANELKQQQQAPAGGWNKLRTWATRRNKAKTTTLDSVNILKHVQTYQEEDLLQEKEEYDKADIYERMEIQQRRQKKNEFQRTALYHDPTFKFEEQQEL